MRFTPTRAMYLKKYELFSSILQSRVGSPNKTDVEGASNDSMTMHR